MKKLLALVLTLALAFSLAGCATPTDTGGSTPDPNATVDPATTPDDATDPTPDDATDPTPATTLTKDTLTVGTPAMNGDFIWGFGNSSYDRYVKNLTGGAYYYATVRSIADGSIIVNDVVVKDQAIEEDEAGNVTYTYTLHEDLKWNDGSAITAKDYVFAILFEASPFWANAGAVTSAGDVLVGYGAYNTGVVSGEEGEGDGVRNIYSNEVRFQGVKLLGDYQFSVTITAQELPYYYETYMSSTSPLCMATHIPGGDIDSNDEGAIITGVDLQACADAVAENERFAPTVTCGPYSFVSFQNQICTLKRNPYFKGDYDGSQPQFENIVIKEVNSATDVDAAIAGDVDLVTGVVEGAKIEAAKSNDNTDVTSYLRNGFGYLAFHTDFGPVADPNVRWAIASLIDRNEVLDYVLGGYGGTVDGPYGLASWFYQERKAEVTAAVSPIAFNIDKANELLDLSEYKFEADGSTPFDASKAVADGSYLRHNANGDPLVINHIGSENNQVTSIISIQYTANAPLAGIQFNITEADFDTLLNHYYDGPKLGDDRIYHTFNLAAGFTAIYDPYYSSYHSDYAGTDYNPYQIADDELDRLIMELRTTEPGDTETFADRFVDFVVRWNALLPCIPLYSNEYFDVFNTSIGGVASTPFSDWAQVVCQLYPTV